MGKVAASSLIETLVALVIIILVLVAATTAYLHLVSIPQEGGGSRLNIEVHSKRSHETIVQKLSDEVIMVHSKVQLEGDSVTCDFLTVNND